MFEVHAFSEEVLYQAAAHVPKHEGAEGRTADEAQKNPRLSYLHDYLDEVGCASILVENEYVDRDFLDDYASYYAKCFEDYDRFCKRLHFFGEDFDADAFDEIVRTGEGLEFERLADSYLGYAILKPLARTFVGRTSLRTYPRDGEDGIRNFPQTHDYEAHVVGGTLNVKALAFQEQDDVVAACATTAVWSALHKTGDLFGNRVPTPAEITRMGTETALSETRGLPSEGLSVPQIYHACAQVGLETLLRESGRVNNLQDILYGYGHFGIPVIIGMTLFHEEIGAEEQPREALDAVHVEGDHAVALSGYHLSEEGKGIPYRSRRMRKLYVHDDQVGPFSRTQFKDKWTLKRQQTNGDGWVYGRVKSLMIPLYPKIRITLEEARKLLAPFSGILGRTEETMHSWDLYLTSVNELRSEISEEDLSPEIRETVLAQNWPRFMWRATALDGEAKIVDVLMDATDIHTSFFVRDVLFRDEDAEEALEAALYDDEAWEEVREEVQMPWNEREFGLWQGYLEDTLT